MNQQDEENLVDELGLAVIAMSGRFPQAEDTNQFWQNLKDGVESISFFSEQELLKSGVKAELLDNPNYVKARAVMSDIDLFDANFFGYSPKEAEEMDPQQRLFLECAWETIERGGYNPDTYEGLIGVYAGVGMNDYLLRNLYPNHDPDNPVNSYQLMISSDKDFLATRVAYKLNLRGPAVNVQTACSTSLVAVHMACQSLLNGECDLALAGGVSIHIPQKAGHLYREGMILSPDGHCRTFDAKAKGTIPGDGVGIVLLKRLNNAIADGDSIQAIIKGSAINNDGSLKVGYTAPSIEGQAAVISEAHAVAGVDPETISYIEAHGTGTELGDPVEIAALTQAFQYSTQNKGFCAIGSLKSNIGHLDAAAGVAGLIKTILALKHKLLPPTLHFEQPNPKIDFVNSPLYVNTTLSEWKTNGTPRRAGVSSFGIGGTNAHVILEEAPEPIKKENSPERPVHLLTLSAKTPKALTQLVSRYHNYFETHQESAIADICYTANTGRAHFNHRLAVIASNQQELLEKLKTHQATEPVTEIFSGEVPGTRIAQVAFLFTGQGSQYVNMGRQLYETQPVFRQGIDECSQILESYLEKSLLEVIYPQNPEDIETSSLLDQTGYTQPALFAIEYALAQLWQSWGIKPDVVMGHSVGEYVAATVAGVFSLEDGLKLIAMRGQLMQKLPAGGKMVSVMASESKVRHLIIPYQERIATAAINGPESIVISGEVEAIDTIVNNLKLAGIKTKELQVSHAFHSPLMEPMLAEFEAVAKEITYSKPRISLISNITGSIADDSIATAKYWINHILQPVKFAQSMESLHQQGYKLFLEIGPKPILLGMGRQCLPEEVGVWLPSLRPGVEEWQQMLSSLGQLYVQGAKIDWLKFDQNYSRQKVALPTYPFQRKRYWLDPNNSFLKKQHWLSGKTIHPLLGKRLNCAGDQQIFQSLLGEDSPAYLSHHRVFNQALFPTTAYLEMAQAAGNYRFKTPNSVVEDLIIQQGFILPAGELISAQTIITPSDNQSYQFQIFSQQEQHNQEEPEWILHATGKIRTAQTDTIPTKVDLEKYLCSQSIEVKQHYQQYRQFGIDYGSSFQGIERLWSGENQALAEIKLPEELIAQTTDYQFHPALLDAALQLIGHVLPEVDSDQTYLPVGVEQFKVYRSPGLSLWAYASVVMPVVDSKESLTTQVTLVSPDGEIVATVKGLQVKLATQETLLRTEVESITNWLYEVEWRTKGILGRLLPPDFLLKPLEVEQKLTPSLTEVVTQVDNVRTSEIARSLEELSVDYIVQALGSMGWSYQPTESFDLEAVVQRLGIVPSQRRLFQRLLKILVEVGILKYNQQQWQVHKTLEKVNPTQQSQSLLSQYPEEAASLTLLDRCASQLGGVLRGAIDPLELVFPQGDLTTATQLYQDSSVTRVMNTIVQKTITQAIEKLPPSRGIRLLEIGAGTGGTTSYVLPHLNPNQTEYIFTDIGALFTSKAQEKFQDYRFVGYQTLDIEVDPTSQGFESHQYDVIIATNVFHATTSIKQTLSHVRQLLAPGGILVLSEATARSRLLDLIFGLLEGWWRFSDYELRPDYPLLSRQQWKEVLSETGFTQVVTLPEVEGMAEVLSEQTVIVAQSATTTNEQTKETPKGWLILADTQGIAQQLASQLRSAGEVCTLVFAGESYQQLAPEEFTINPHNPEEFEQLIEAVATKSPSLSGVVQCWTTEAGIGKTISSLELKNLSQLGCGTTLSLVQALVKAKLSQSPRLWLVTNGAQPVPSNHPVVPGVAQSTLWGMGKVIGLEHPELNCVRIDLDPQQTIEIQGNTLFQEIWSEDREDQVAWRGDGRYVARLVASPHQQAISQQQQLLSQPSTQKADATTQKPLSFREDACYLITGGMGGLGLLVARWMVDKGAKHLVLLGRCSPDDATSQKITELEMAGASVVVEKADMSDPELMTRVVHKIEQSNIPLAGVIHSAEMLSDGVLQNQIWSSFEQVMAPKVQGTWHLHQLTQNQPLDFFVLFSSAASLLGSPGQGNHSAANGFLDGLAHYRRGMGLPGLSIHWGPVAQVGEAAERGVDMRASEQGMSVLSPTQVLQSLELLMSGSDIEVGVVPIDWSAWQERVAQWSFLADWQETIQTTSEISKSEFLLKLEATAANERRSLLVAHVRSQLALLLGINHPESIALETGFFDLGMDSLTSVELRNKLQTSLDCSLPSSLAFDYPNIQSLTDYLEKIIILASDDTGAESETSEVMLDGNSFELEISKNRFSEISLLSEDEMDIEVAQAVSKLEQLL
ncbi:MAG: SDR family NAD(P)-dependent oxidoreductase [Moorea sp. SIOASIH]|uniref:VatT n=1 Tax=Moorena producens ASI16Jul14-2 TaxID=2546228 RepID=A0A4P8JAK3_9CYAN|nr:type I polyketide synthase [Moorena sp. SIOASIH]NEO38502.1 SDR family NAD(P)-dependent oxidoreductase [Moorena sp. SIOASIH]QCP68967.1 VatT [Moorena producens ASI16Jul14-2]